MSNVMSKVLAVALIGFAIGAGATPTTDLGQLKQVLAAASRLYLYLPLTHRPDSGATPGHGTTSWGSLHVDIAARKLALDGPGFRYRYAAGRTTFHDRTMGRSTPAMRVPVADAMFGAALTQLDQGFANATWTRRDPPVVAPGLEAHHGQSWWQMALPDAWDDPYRIFVQLTPTPGCEVWQVAVLYAEVDRIVQIGNPVGGAGWLDLRFPLCERMQIDPYFQQSRYGAPADPFAETLFLQRTLHVDEFRPVW
ncbi:MAG: hypothetical protein ABMA64_25200 [Myxococcota bacterium]